MTGQYAWACLGLICAVFIWSGQAVVARSLMTLDNNYTAYQNASLRNLIAGAVLLPIALSFAIKNMDMIWRDRIVIVKTTIFGTTLHIFMLMSGSEHTTALNASIMMGSLPILTIVLGYIFYKQPISIEKLGYVFLSLLGIVLIISKGDISVLRKFQFNIGDIYMLGSAVSWAIYTLILQYDKRDIEPLPLLGINYILGTVLSIIFIVIVGDTELNANVWQTDFTLLVLYTALMAGVVATVMYMIVTPIVGSVSASIFINLVPVLGGLGGVLILGEQFHIYHGIGGIIIGFSVYKVVSLSMQQAQPT